MESNTPLLIRGIGTKAVVIAITAIVMSGTLLINCSADDIQSDSVSDASADDQMKATELYCGFEENFVPPFYFFYGAEHAQSDAQSHTGNYSYAMQSDLEVIALHPKEWLAGGDASSQPSRIVVWMYDPGPWYHDEATVRVSDSLANGISIGIRGYMSSDYYYRINADFYYTDIEREVGWHKFEFRISNMGTTCFIDDIEICDTAVLTAIDMLALGDWWGDGIVSSNAAFDDVVVTFGQVGLW
jgi:hypothetical protein